KFLNAQPKEIIFTKGATESLNMIAEMLRHFIKPGDEIITSELEHHSCLLPWMRIAKEKQAKLIFIPLDKDYKITVDNFCQVLSNKTKFVVLNHISNTFGYETPIKEITYIAHQKNILVILDAAQSAADHKLPHNPKKVDLTKIKDPETGQGINLTTAERHARDESFFRICMA
ncbi:MAG: aminotransferase class V-fold PLP-dependent enzyme, partial [Sweet potato little leaf phytoplasma]|nr:aminotransferase class V-fold PLP-dependent enzyme [Sweet potato little leaf phytoplasma]